MSTRSFRRAFVVGAYLPDGGTVMAYHLGRILEKDFGIKAIAVAVGNENSEHGVHAYDLRMPIVSRDEMERQITDDDILLVNAGFSRFQFGWRIPGFKVGYIQGFAQFNLLDRRLDHYVAVSDVVARFLSVVYDINARVIPPFITVDEPEEYRPWEARPAMMVPPSARRARKSCCSAIKTAASPRA